MSKVGKLVLMGLVCIFLVSGFGGLSLSKESMDEWQEYKNKIYQKLKNFENVIESPNIQEWIILAEENGSSTAIWRLNVIDKAVKKASEYGSPILAFNLHDQVYFVNIVAVPQQPMPQWIAPILFDSSMGEYNIYLYNRLFQQKEKAEMYLKERKVKEAIDVFMDWIADAPDFAVSHFYLGDIYLSQRNFSKAVLHYEIGLEYNRANLRILSNLGYTYMKNGDLKKAAETFERLVKIQPENIEAHFALLNVYKKLEDNIGIYKQKREIKKWRGIMDPFWWVRFWEKLEELELKPKFWFKN